MSELAMVLAVVFYLLQRSKTSSSSSQAQGAMTPVRTDFYSSNETGNYDDGHNFGWKKFGP